MYFKEIEIKNFRNYEYCKETFDPGINIFIGMNGQGKSSLAEALYIMCLGRSFRTHREKEMIRFGEDSAYAGSVVCRDGRNIRTEIMLSKKDKKVVKINGTVRRKSDLSNNVLIVVFSPEDLRIIKEDPDKRRRFINREISQLRPSYYSALSGYTRILEQRNALLRSGNASADLLDVWNEEIIRYGIKLMKDRNEFICMLNDISSGIHSDITEGSEKLLIEYDPDIPYSDNIDELSENYRDSLSKSLDNDLMRGITYRGPHRDDIKVSINGIDTRKFGSQGQQRTAALSLKLAEIELIERESGEKPVLILDDVLSELDRSRQSYLIKTFDGIQIFLTSTHIGDEIIDGFDEKSIYEIKNGNITKAVR